MKKDISDSLHWEDDFDRKKKRGSVKKGKSANYKRKEKYKKNYLDQQFSKGFFEELWDAQISY